MEIVYTSTKITCLIEMALKGENSWLTLGLLIDGLTPTLARSREIIRILWKELETHQNSEFTQVKNHTSAKFAIKGLLNLTL